MKGLIIKEKWINLIFSGAKCWEIRGGSTKIRGQIYLIQSGTKHIYGVAELVDCIELDLNTYKNSKQKHCIDDCDELPYKKTYAWVIKNAKRLEHPMPYRHPNGAIIWVNIDDNPTLLENVKKLLLKFND